MSPEASRNAPKSGGGIAFPDTPEPDAAEVAGASLHDRGLDGEKAFPRPNSAQNALLTSMGFFAFRIRAWVPAAKAGPIKPKQPQKDSGIGGIPRLYAGAQPRTRGGRGREESTYRKLTDILGAIDLASKSGSGGIAVPDTSGPDAVEVAGPSLPDRGLDGEKAFPRSNSAQNALLTSMGFFVWDPCFGSRRHGWADKAQTASKDSGIGGIPRLYAGAQPGTRGGGSLDNGDLASKGARASGKYDMNQSSTILWQRDVSSDPSPRADDWKGVVVPSRPLADIEMGDRDAANGSNNSVSAVLNTKVGKLWGLLRMSEIHNPDLTPPELVRKVYSGDGEAVVQPFFA